MGFILYFSMANVFAWMPDGGASGEEISSFVWSTLGLAFASVTRADESGF